MSRAGTDDAPRARLHRFLAVLLMTCGLLLNPYLLGLLLTADGHLDDAPTWVVLLALDALALGAGAWLWLHRRGPPWRQLAFASGLVLLPLAFLKLVDVGLGLAGFAAVFEQQYVHPPDYHEERRALEFSYEFRTNSQGLRYDEIPLAKESPKERRILVLGDSFTEGWGVGQEEAFPLVLERLFQRPDRTIRFINAGVAATGPEHQMRILFHVGLRYEIDGVLLCVYMNDLRDTTAREDFRPRLRDTQRSLAGDVLHATYPHIYALVHRVASLWTSERRRSDDLMARVKELASQRGISEEAVRAWAERIPSELIEASDEGRFNGAFLARGLLEPDYWVGSIELARPADRQRWRNMRAILDVMREELSDRGVPLAIAYIPSAVRYDPRVHDPSHLWRRAGFEMRETWLSGQAPFPRALSTWARSREVPFLDLTETFRSARVSEAPRLYYPRDGHLTAKGHRLVAESIGRWLRRIDFGGLSRPRRPAEP